MQRTPVSHNLFNRCCHFAYGDAAMWLNCIWHLKKAIFTQNFAMSATPDHACFFLFFSSSFLHDSKSCVSWTLVTMPFPPPLPGWVSGWVGGGGSAAPPKEAKYQDSSHNYPAPAFILLDKHIYRKQNQQTLRLLFCLRGSIETATKIPTQ